LLRQISRSSTNLLRLDHVAMDVNAQQWPLILSGPMPRRIEPESVNIFVACKHAKTVRLSIYEGTTADPRRRVCMQDTPTVRLGRYLHVAMATGSSAFRAGRIYGYDIELRDNETSGVNLQDLGLLDRVNYGPGRLPSFVLPPEDLENVRFVHGSCRKPQAERRDALGTLDQILDGSHRDPHARPQQLFLTGDQLYADDVDPVLLWLAGNVGRAALGQDRAEVLPDIDAEDFQLAPTRRDSLLRHRARYTSPKLHSHLMTFAEFVGMYLLIWSDAVWPRDDFGTPTVPTPEEVFDDPRWFTAPLRREYDGAIKLASHTRPDVLEFARTVPRVRRALANIATYMILDDHDVTDDWNLHRQWQDNVLRRPLGRRLVQNALSSYAVFQGWGNDPAQYAADQPGGRLLASLGKWNGDAGVVAETIAASVGLPSTHAATAIRFDYQIDTPSYQVIVLDTRTQRGFPLDRTGRQAPSLLSEQAIERQLIQRLNARTREIPVTIIVSAAPVFGHPLIEAWVQLKRIKAIEWFERGPEIVDREAWSLNRTGFEMLLATLAWFERVVILSGDVHYGFAGSVAYWDRRDGDVRSARFIQLTSSALKGEDNRTRLVGGVPTVSRVPAVLGARVQLALARLTNPPPVSFVGWSTDPRVRWLQLRHRRRAYAPLVLPSPIGQRVVREPEWGYHMDFRAYPDAPPPVPGRSADWHNRARRLRAQYGWSFMHVIVGRNNVGDVEFLHSDPHEPSGVPDLVRQSLWFDKTSIRFGGEPERLPYTAYDLPLTLPPPADTAQWANPRALRG
jgi:hypothetical protein